MAGDLQPLERTFPIAHPDGRPTDYFIRWAQTRQIDISNGITLAQLEEYLAAHQIQPGDGIDIAPDGNLSSSPTISAKVQEILDQITDVHGSILFRGASDWEALGPGTSGDFLKTNGAGADPEWATAGGSGGGGLTLLEQHTASSSASLDFTASISSTYDEYLIEFIALIPATNATALLLRMSTNGGSSYDSGGNYSWTAVATNRFGQTSAGADSAATFIQCNGTTLANTSTAGYGGSFRLFDPLNTSRHKLVSGTGSALLSDATTLSNEQFGGYYRSTTAVNAFQILFSSGNIASGTVRVYGIQK